MAKKPRILIVTPEVTSLPEDMGSRSNFSAKAGGLADVSAALISALFELGCDVHVALPDYRALNHEKTFPKSNPKLEKMRKRLDEERIHLAADRAFFYLKSVYSGYSDHDLKVALAFQREVINNIIPRVEPDIIHCNDWMTGLIPAMARQIEIPCLFTIHNIHTMTSTMAEIEDRGIDAAAFWKWLFFKRPPVNYEESRDWNRVDFLASGIFAAHYVNTVSPTFLHEIVDNRHSFVEPCVQSELAHKFHSGCATGILNAPEPEFNPSVDERIRYNYGPLDQDILKQKNKAYLQQILDLELNASAPLFFWPSRLDPVQKGCQLLADILYEIVSRYWDTGIQVVFVASGSYEAHFHEIVRFHNLSHRICVCGFNEALSHQAFAASDFLFMPSAFEPCGLPQMVGPIYGSLPIVFDTGGLHDTIRPLVPEEDTGNGFVFNVHDARGLSWAVDQAMHFFAMDPDLKARQIRRIMMDSVLEFNHSRCAESYIDLYGKMLQRPFLV